ncbi:MAG: hypothetical protein JW712_08125 [Dehalococcoidales bacterium]|nr:hypothetical protein [Dehalococcoidales bacterium]
MVNNNQYTSTIATLTWGDPNAYQRVVQAEDRIQNRDSRDPDQAPAPEEGDRIILLAAIAGIIIGGVVGFLVGMNVFGRSGVFLGIIIGIIVGGLAGTYAGSYLKKKFKAKNDRNQLNAGM